MKKKNKNNYSSLIYFIGPLIVYEIAFVIFILYYSRQNSNWFRISYLLIGIAFIVAFFRILGCFKKWEHSYASNRKAYIICLLSYFTNSVLYIFCLFIQADQWRSLQQPPSLLFILLAVPMLIEFILFLAVDPGKKQETRS